MKKSIFLLMGASLAMASCSSDETTGLNSGAELKIVANTDAASRSEIVQHVLFGGFKVTALSPDGSTYFDQVGMNFKNGKFVPATGQSIFWPGTGDLDLYAWSPQNVEGVTVSKDGKTIKNFTPASKIRSQYDLLTSSQTAVRPADLSTPVNLLFKHATAAIMFRGLTYNQNYDIKVKQIKLENFVGTGDYTFAPAAAGNNNNYNRKEFGTWTLTGNATAEYLGETRNPDLIPVSISGSNNLKTPSLTKDENDESGNAQFFFIIPQTIKPWTSANKNAARVGFLVSYTSKTNGQSVLQGTDADGYKWVYSTLCTSDRTFEAGCIYMYTVDFTNLGGREGEDPDSPAVKDLNMTVGVNLWEGPSDTRIEEEF